MLPSIVLALDAPDAQRDSTLVTRRGIELTVEALATVRAARSPLRRDARAVRALERAVALLDEARIELSRAVAGLMVDDRRRA